MKPTESPNAQQKAGVASGAPKQNQAIEPPTQPFVLVDGDGPGDPSKFQRFIVPKEFIEKVNSVELPGLDPDDLVETDPPNHSLLEVDGHPRTNSDERKSGSPHSAQAASQETVVITKRRKSAPIPKELLSEAPAAGRKSILGNKILWVLGGVLVVLILLWSHLKGGSDPMGTRLDSRASASVPLLVPPAPEPRLATPNSRTQAMPAVSGNSANAEATGAAKAESEPEKTPSPARVPNNSTKKVTSSSTQSKTPAIPSRTPSTPAAASNGTAPVFQPE